jgi:purine-nucleoside phosphorylase
MSTHIGARPGQIAPHVLMPGDPLRARWIAETFLDDAECYTEVRGMLGYTGTFQGRPVSVQGSGMGLPSISIYATELFTEYDVQAIVRVGSCGALSPAFEGLDYAPVADFDLLRRAYDAAQSQPVTSKVGLLLSSDSFYHPRPELTQRMAEHGVIAVEMEASALYTLAAKHRRRALAICTVSDHIVTGAETTAAERQETFTHMVHIALEALPG